jgi:hypothetical protein
METAGNTVSEIDPASVSKETISRITDKVIEEMQDWAARPLDAIYAAVFIGAIVVKVRDGQVANRPFYAGPCVVCRLRSGDRMRQLGGRSEAVRKFGERVPDLVVDRLFAGEFVVAAAQVLHERMTRGDNAKRADRLHPAHRP